MEAAQAARQAEIISVLDIPSPEATRLGKTDVMVTYRIDPLHSFTIRMPKEDATTGKVKAAIQADWNTRKELFGAKISLT